MFAGVVALLGTICESVTKQEKNKNKDDFFFLGAVQFEGSFCSLLNSLRAGKTNYFFASQRGTLKAVTPGGHGRRRSARWQNPPRGVDAGRVFSDSRSVYPTSPFGSGEKAVIGFPTLEPPGG